MRNRLRSGGRIDKRHVRRAAVLATTAVCTTVIVGFAALAIDMGYVQLVRTQLQTAADASALAGASALLGSSGLTKSATQESLAAESRARAIAYAAKNEAGGKALNLRPSEVSVGHIYNPANLNENIGSEIQPYNSVNVRLALEKDGANSPISLIFARIWGKEQINVAASATAFLEDHMSGYHPKSNGGPLIPVTVRIEKWNDEIVQGNGDDCYGFDAVTGEITYGPDGIPEISIYPEKQNKKNDGNSGAGNFGLLNFENGNNGTPSLAQQIRDGLCEDNFIRTLGSPTIEFYSVDGSAICHAISGNPGLKASLDDDFSSKMGQVIGFFIHSQVQGTGANTVFTIVNIQFGRVMEVDLHGSQNDKAVVIQPTGYSGSEIITNPNAPRHATAGLIQLIR